MSVLSTARRVEHRRRGRTKEAMPMRRSKVMATLTLTLALTLALTLTLTPTLTLTLARR